MKLATSVVNGAIVHFTTFLYLCESYGFDKPHSPRERDILLLLHPHLSLGVTNEEHYISPVINGRPEGDGGRGEDDLG